MVVVAEILQTLPLAIFVVYFVRFATGRGMILRPLFLPFMIRAAKSKREWALWRNILKDTRRKFNLHNVTDRAAILYFGNIQPQRHAYFSVRRKYRIWKWLEKPLWACALCMASVYGSLVWFGVYGFTAWEYWPLFCVALSGSIYLLEKILSFFQRPAIPTAIKMQSYNHTVWAQWKGRNGLNNWKSEVDKMLQK